MNEYEDAIKVWIVKKEQLGIDPDMIDSVKFDTIQEGYCETCEYTTMGITYTIKGKYGERDILMEGILPAEFVREVSEIYQSMKG